MDVDENTDHNVDPRTCPFCEGTILKNETYLIKHLEQFHKGNKLPTDNKEGLKIKERGNSEWIARIHNEQKPEEVSDLKIEVNNETGNWNNKSVRVKNELDKELQKHESTSGDMKNALIFICEDCGKDFKKAFMLKKHKLVHSDQKPFCCMECPKTFTSKLGVDYHLLSRTNERPFMCDICPQTFTTKWTLIQHKLIHTGVKPFQCDDCGKSFRLKDSMKIHKKIIHNKEKPFMCNVCPQAFVTKTKFKQHTLIHTGEKPFPCDECGASFRLKFVLKKHKKVVHNDDKTPHMCLQCGKLFHSAMALGGHIAAGHPKEEQCKICPVCSKKYKTTASFKQHQRKHEEKTNCICSECGKICKSKRALLDHNRATHPNEGQRRFCSLCGTQFKNSANLRQHLRKSVVCSSKSTTISVPAISDPVMPIPAMYIV